jgi:putative MATE family efflux protein
VSILQKPHRETQMALDFVKVGKDNIGVSGEDEKVTNELPAEVNSKILYNDIFRIAWPSLVELTLTQLTSMVDLIMVGQLGAWAISAVGLTTQPKFLMMIMFMAMNIGATALVARYKGSGEHQKANTILRQALFLTFILSVAASIVGFVFAESLVRFMGAADAQTLAGGTSYLKIQMLGFVALALTSTITATLRGVGNSKIAMTYNLVANIVNVVFNYLLIYGNFGFPRMGVSGASLATIIGQFTAFLLALFAVLRGNQYLKLNLKDGFKPQREHLKNIFNIGIPAMIEQFVMRAGMIIYAITVASLGTVAYAIHQISLNILSISFMNGQAFAVAATSLVGQSLGKKRPDFAQSYSSHTRRLGMLFATVIALIFFFFGKPIVSLYNNDPEIVSQGAKVLMLIAFVQPFQSSQLILTGVLRGAGDTRATAIIAFITILLIRPSLAIFNIRVLDWGLMGAWVALLVDQMLRSLLVILRFNSGKWKNIKVYN